MSGIPAALTNQNSKEMAARVVKRKRFSKTFYLLCVAIAFVSVLVLAVLLISIGSETSPAWRSSRWYWACSTTAPHVNRC